MRFLSHKEAKKLAFSPKFEDRLKAAKNYNTPPQLLLLLTQDKEPVIREVALKTYQEKQRIMEELSILRGLQAKYEELTSKDLDEIPEEEWVILQDYFWNLKIIHKRFEKWFEKKFGYGSIERYDKIDHYGYYADQFMMEILSKKEGKK